MKKKNKQQKILSKKKNVESIVDDDVFDKTEIIDIPSEINNKSGEYDNVIESALEFKDSENVVKKNNKLLYVLVVCLVFIFSFFVVFFFKCSIKFRYDKLNYEVDVFEEFTNPTVTACYGNLFKCRSIDVSIDSNVDTSKIGFYKVIYSAKYKKKNKDFIVNISVVDKENPVIETVNNSLSVCPNANDFNIEYKAHDNYDGDLTSNVSKHVDGDILTLSVTDSSNNIGNKDIKLIREDFEGPSITINGNSPIYLPVGSSYSDAGATALDNCDLDVSSNISISGSVDTSKAGSYGITYTVSDTFGNSSTVTRDVYVYASNGTGDKIVYLTFDDGPSAYTGELLDILARYNVKATFFVTNRNPNYNHFIKRAYEEGHTIALHTSSHNYSQVYSSVDAYFSDLNAINETVKNITGSYSYLIRFPGGSSNTVSRNYSIGIMTTLSQMVTDKGYKYFDWNVSSSDADGKNHSSSDYANNIINGINGKSMSIVLQHDTNVNSIRSISTVIEYGLSHGYTFKPLDMTSPVVHHKINN